MMNSGGHTHFKGPTLNLHGAGSRRPRVCSLSYPREITVSEEPERPLTRQSLVYCGSCRTRGRGCCRLILYSSGRGYGNQSHGGRVGFCSYDQRLMESSDALHCLLIQGTFLLALPDKGLNSVAFAYMLCIYSVHSTSCSLVCKAIFV